MVDILSIERSLDQHVYQLPVGHRARKEYELFLLQAARDDATIERLEDQLKFKRIQLWAYRIFAVAVIVAALVERFLL